eukprot:CAMPEP_0119405636 /NCGR_PEP_ID=MMETSP1335-20130426/237_1 /TAXON_ID=259385 /ORGANISM="Chrysoculter rhomboideus, Strain RCC1486" /LENGTH=116 /DNA_ID=CAMNT_0007429657 /DNA_START=134 /DNA_END=485 /DNA_ORIENTATION=+
MGHTSGAVRVAVRALSAAPGAGAQGQSHPGRLCAHLIAGRDGDWRAPVAQIGCRTVGLSVLRTPVRVRASSLPTRARRVGRSDAAKLGVTAADLVRARSRGGERSQAGAPTARKVL